MAYNNNAVLSELDTRGRVSSVFLLSLPPIVEMSVDTEGCNSVTCDTQLKEQLADITTAWFQILQAAHFTWLPMLFIFLKLFISLMNWGHLF